MKTLTIGKNQYEIMDEWARNEIATLEETINDFYEEWQFELEDGSIITKVVCVK